MAQGSTLPDDFFRKRSERLLLGARSAIEASLHHLPASRLPWLSAGRPRMPSMNPVRDVRGMWDWIRAVPYCPGPSVPVLDRRMLPQFPNANRDWEGIAAGLNRVGRPSGGGEFMRPSGKWVLDLVSDRDGSRILEAAHALAHARRLASSGLVRSGLVECVAELAFCRMFGLSFSCPTVDDISAGAVRRGGDVGRLGIRFSVTTDMRHPWMTVPANGASDPDGPVQDVDSMVVLCGVHLEPQPWSAREGNPDSGDETWLEMNRWSCMPSIVSVCGFAFMDEVHQAPLVGRWRSSGLEDCCFTMPVAAMHGPSSLDGVLALCAGNGPGSRDGGEFTVDGFLKSGLLAGLLKITPPFPCRDCLSLNMSSDGAPTRPSCRRPSERDGRAWKGHKAEATPAEAEWAEYDAKVDKIVRVVEKACEFHDRRFKYGTNGKRIRRKRRSNAAKAARLLAMARAALRREEGLVRKAMYAKATDERVKRDVAMSAIADIINGPLDNCASSDASGETTTTKQANTGEIHENQP